MSDPETQTTSVDSESCDPWHVPAALSPADAEDVRSAGLAALAAATAAGRGLVVSIDGDEDRIMPCAMQLIIAAKRSAEQLGIAVTLEGEASAALEDIAFR